MADGDELNIPSGTATMLDTDNTPVFVPLDRVQEQVGKGYQRGTYMTDKDNNTVIVGHNRLAEAYKKGYKVGPASQADVGAPPKPGLYTKLAMNVLGAPFGQQPTPLSAKDFQQGWQDTKTAASETGRIGLGVAKSMAPPISPPAVPPELRDKMPEWYNTLSDAGIGAPAAGQSMGQGMIQAGKQSVEQFKKKQYVRAGVSGAAALDPFAGGPVSQVNQLEESGQGDEAAVRGGVDALALGLGGKLQEGGLKAIADKINKPNMPAVHEALSSLIDTKAGKVNPFRTAQATADAIRNEAAKQGIRKSQFKGREGNELGAKIVDDTINSHNAEVKGLAQPLMKDTVDLRPIAKAIRDEITDEMRNNAPALAKRLETEAASFDRNGTLQEVDDFRTRKNGDLGSYYKKGQTEQIASDKEAGAADAGVRAARQIEYDHIGNRSGVDPAYIKGLADKETDLINVRNDINKRVNEASSQQSKAKAQGFFEEVFGTKGKADIADVKSGIFKSLLGAKPVDVLNNRFKTIYGKNFNVTPTVQPPAPGGVPPLGPNRPALPAGQYPAGASSLFEGQKQLPAATDTTLHQPPIDQPGQLVNAVRMSGRDVSTGRFKQAFGTSPQEAIAYKPISQFPGVMRSIDAAMKAKGTSPKVQAAVIEDLRRAMEQKYQQTVPSPQQTPPTAPAGQPFDPNTWTTPPGFTSDAKPLSGPNLLSSSLDRTGNTDLSARAGEAAKRVIAEDQAKPTSEQIAEKLRQLNPEGVRGNKAGTRAGTAPNKTGFTEPEKAPPGLGIPDDLWVRLTPEGKEMWAKAAQNVIADKAAQQAQWRRDAGLMGRVQFREGVQPSPEGTETQNAAIDAGVQIPTPAEIEASLEREITAERMAGKKKDSPAPASNIAALHYSNDPTIGQLDPSRFGENDYTRGEVRRHTEFPQETQPNTFLGEAGTYKGEPRITQKPYRYKANVPSSDVYDLRKDPEGLIPKAVESARQNKFYGQNAIISTLEKLVRDRGYKGTVDSNGVMRMWNKVSVEPNPREAFVMSSPNVSENAMSIADAEKATQTPEHANFMKHGEEAAKNYGLDAKVSPAVGNWTDGSENSVHMEIQQPFSMSRSEFSSKINAIAAEMGKTGNQKYVAIFNEMEGGPDHFHVIEIPKGKMTTTEIANALDKNGINNRTIYEKNGSIVISSIDKGKQLDTNFDAAAKDLGAKEYSTYEGQGDFNGAENREDARKIFDNQIRSEAERSGKALPPWIRGGNISRAEAPEATRASQIGGTDVSKTLGARPSGFASKTTSSQGGFARTDIPSVLAEGAGKIADMFYSKLKNVAEEKLPNKIVASSVIPTLKNAGVSTDQINWADIDEFLKGKQTVNKQDLLDHIKQNDIQISDVTLGGREVKFADVQNVKKWVKANRDKLTLGEGQNIIADIEEAANGDRGAIGNLEVSGIPDELIKPFKNPAGPRQGTKYDEYQTPGGKNYKEMLLTLKGKNDPNASQFSLVRDSGANEFYTIHNQAGTEVGQVYPTNSGNWAAETTVFGRRIFNSFEDAKDYAQNLASKELGGSGVSHFTGGHYKNIAPDVLAHTRFNDRFIPDKNGPTGPYEAGDNLQRGYKTLHLEEVQSDWHEIGRKTGYQEKASESDKDNAYSRFSAAQAKYTNITDKIDNISTTDKNFDRQAYKELVDERNRLADERDAAYDDWNRVRDNSGKVPNAPFKKNWHELVMKRMLRYAAENGYDRLSWTTGETQNQRYDLSKQVDGIGYKNNPNGTYDIYLKRKGEDDYARPDGQGLDNVKKEKLPDVVGKELANKIIAGEGNEWSSKSPYMPVPNGKVFEGVDLKVGGSGMKGFYDKMIPDFMNKYGKKWGAKVGESQIEYGEESELRKKLIDHEYNPDAVDLQRLLSDYGGRGPSWLTSKELDAIEQGEHYQSSGNIKKEKIHSIDITPAMKKEVMQKGQPISEQRLPASLPPKIRTLMGESA